MSSMGVHFGFSGKDACPCTQARHNSMQALSSGTRTHSGQQAKLRQSFAQPGRQGGRSQVVTAATKASNLTAKEAEELANDIRKLEERESWYTARFVADDAPDWNPATFVDAVPVANGLTRVVLDIEIGRERVPLRNAYRHVGQTASIRVNSGEEYSLKPCSAPFSISLQQDPLYKARGDLTAGEIKTVVEPTSVTARLEVVVPDGEAVELVKASAADSIEVGPFKGAGLNLRGDIISMFAYRTIVIFCEGLGIATAKALVEAHSSAGGLNLAMREDVRMYYRAQNREELAFKDQLDSWAGLGCKVQSATRDAFIDMFDDDDTLAYEPATTAAIFLVAGDEDAEKAAQLVCTEAEITEIVKDSEEQVPTEYLSMRTHQAGKH